VYDSPRLRRRVAALVVGAALLAPLPPTVSASASPSAGHPAASAKPAGRATQSSLTAYGDPDASGATHLSGSLRWANGKVLGHQQHVELWAKSRTMWALIQKAVTDRRGDVELRVAPGAHTKYQLRYAGSRASRLASAARPSRSPSVTVRAVAHVTVRAPAKVHRGETFVVTGKVTPRGAGRVVTLAGNGKPFTPLTTRADGSFSGHVRLTMTTTLSIALPDTASLDGALSGPRTVRVG
jgi:hypothetical protein